MTASGVQLSTTCPPPPSPSAAAPPATARSTLLWLFRRAAHNLPFIQAHLGVRYPRLAREELQLICRTRSQRSASAGTGEGGSVRGGAVASQVATTARPGGAERAAWEACDEVVEIHLEGAGAGLYYVYNL